MAGWGRDLAQKVWLGAGGGGLRRSICSAGASRRGPPAQSCLCSASHQFITGDHMANILSHVRARRAKQTSAGRRAARARETRRGGRAGRRGEASREGGPTHPLQPPPPPPPPLPPSLSKAESNSRAEAGGSSRSPSGPAATRGRKGPAQTLPEVPAGGQPCPDPHPPGLRPSLPPTGRASDVGGSVAAGEKMLWGPGGGGGGAIRQAGRRGSVAEPGRMGAAPEPQAGPTQN